MKLQAARKEERENASSMICTSPMYCDPSRFFLLPPVALVIGKWLTVLEMLVNEWPLASWSLLVRENVRVTSSDPFFNFDERIGASRVRGRRPSANPFACQAAGTLDSVVLSTNPCLQKRRSSIVTSFFHLRFVHFWVRKAETFFGYQIELVAQV
jgi:hypothetical protein